MKIKTDEKLKVSRNILVVYAVSGAVLFNFVQYTLYGIYWLLPGSLNSENNLRGTICLIDLVISLPASFVSACLGLDHINNPWALGFFQVLINGLVGAFLVTTGMLICKFIKNGYWEVTP
jgi:hypothetical protein